MALAVVNTAPPTDSPHQAKPMVSIDSVTMSFGAYVAVQDVNLSVADGEFLAIVGPTGCGKSTILNAIAGLLKPSSGTVAIDGQLVRGVQNDIGYLFQQDAVMSWKTVRTAGSACQVTRRDEARTQRASPVPRRICSRR